MYRYIAFTWNHRRAESASTAQILAQYLASELSAWRCVLDTNELRVYHLMEQAGSSDAYTLVDDSGVVLGKVFEKPGNSVGRSNDFAFSQQEAKRIVDTNGRHIVEQYWGRYVALIRDVQHKCIRVVRDPSGALPCFLFDYKGINVLCSHMDDCAALGLTSRDINWDHVAAYLSFPRLITEDTGLKGVREVRAGECVTLADGKTSSNFYWRPDQVHDARIVENHQQALQELRSTIQYCVTAWASCYGRILHSLSGGLDSAIVLACLSSGASNAKVVCQNYFTEAARGDERYFASIAAEKAGVELIETAIQPLARPIEKMLSSVKVATPTRNHMEPAVTAARRVFVQERGIGAVFSGQGGDHFFQQSRIRAIAADYAWHHGWRPELGKVIADTSRFTRKPILSVVASVLYSGLLRRLSDPYDRRIVASPLASDSTLDAFSSYNFRHAWLDTAQLLPMGKVRQIVSIADTQNFFRVPFDSADTVHPLISQPIIELCLQIPSYVLTYGGIDRALVREAFTDIVPSEILTRTTKGGTASYYVKLTVGSLPFLRDFLLSGVLVSEGLLDKHKTEAVLTEACLLGNSPPIVPLLTAVKAESWLRAWTNVEHRAAA